MSWNQFAYSSAIGAALLSACSPTGQSGPSWTSPESNIAYAVSAICAPYVLDNEEAAGLPMSQPLVRDDGWRASGDKLEGGHVHVGVAGAVHVAIGDVNGGRACEIVSAGADPQAMRHAVLAALAKRPEAFAPTRSRYLPGRFATQDYLCASAQSRNPSAIALISAGDPRQSGVSFIVTIGYGGSRPLECDQPGVQLNYLTLADPQ